MPEDLRTVRNRKNVRVNQLAPKSGISIATLIQYEKGELEIPPDDLGRLAKALYVDEWDINPRSSLPPAPPGKERPAKPPRAEEKAPQEKPRPKSPPAPVWTPLQRWSCSCSGWDAPATTKSSSRRYTKTQFNL